MISYLQRFTSAMKDPELLNSSKTAQPSQSTSLPHLHPATCVGNHSKKQSKDNPLLDDSQTTPSLVPELATSTREPGYSSQQQQLIFHVFSKELLHAAMWLKLPKG
jgi:hypothetical protein